MPEESFELRRGSSNRRSSYRESTLVWGYCEHSYNNTLQSRIQITWHYRQPKETKILDEKGYPYPFKYFVTTDVTFF